VVGLAVSLTAAYAMSRFSFPGRKLGLTGLLATQMFPATMMSVPLYAILNRLQLLNSLTGLVLVYATTSVPFCVWMLKGYFDTIPRDLEEAALLDGASPGQIFRKVVLPLARPAIAVTALFSFMTAWNEFILAATFLDDAARFTLPVALQRFVGEYRTEWGKFAAGALVVSAPVMAVFFALQRHLVGGLTAGGVKG
jgi:arabinogalactan oligomer/maltooligosaccharide transport system permease protein